MTFDLEILPDEEWAALVANRLEAKLGPGARICLATGTTPVPVYHALSGSGAFAEVVTFLLDEYGGLPPGDPGRCTSMITRDLVERVEPPPTVMSPEVDHDDPGEAAAAYRELIGDCGLDLAVLGLGANGHIGMNEPGSTAESVTRVAHLDESTSRSAAGYGATATPTWGITVGMSELLAASEVWLLVTGEHKRDILNRTLHGAVDSDVPATFLTEHPNCVFFVDESAGLTG